MENRTYKAAYSARQLLKRAVSAREHAERPWASAVGEALASDMPVASVAIWAEVSVDEAIAAVDNPHIRRAC